MKKITLILLSILMIVALAACGDKCEQHVYDDCADTECNLCGNKRDSMHTWTEAYCTTPKTCTVCGATEGSALGHEWTTPDADLCEVRSTCSRCGATDGENKEHTPAEDDGDCTTEVKCTVCDSVTTPANPEHTPSADDGDCTTPIICTECSHVCTAAESHDFGDEWEKDADGHWQVCQNESCTAESKKQEHTPAENDGDCTTEVKCTACDSVTTSANPEHTPSADDGNCTTPIICTECSHVCTEAESHDFGDEWEKDADGHWQVCQNESCTVESTKQEHTPAENDGDCTTEVKCTACDAVTTPAAQHIPNADDGDCTTPITCSECGKTCTEAESHDFSGKWENDADGHYRVCRNEGCTAESIKQEHIPDQDQATTLAPKKCTECEYIIEPQIPFTVTVEGGTFANGMTEGKFLLGETLTLTGAEHWHVTVNGVVSHVYDTLVTVTGDAAYAACTDENEPTTSHSFRCPVCYFAGVRSCTPVDIVYTWVSDYSACQGKGVCEICNEDVVDVAGSTLENDTYTAVFTKPGFSTQTYTADAATVFANSIKKGGTFALSKSLDFGDNYLYIPEGVTVTIDLNGYSLSSSNSEHTIFNRGTLIITDSVGTGRITGAATYAVFCPGTADSITVRGGTVNGIRTNRPIFIEGGLITGENALYISMTEAKITSGTITGVVETGGSGSMITIEGGTFNCKFDIGGAAMAISGGSFSQDPSAYVKAGYRVTKSDTMWTVVPDPDYVDDGTVTTLADLLFAIEAGEEIKLGSDITSVSYITISSSMTLDLNGHTLTLADDITVYSGAALTVKNGTLISNRGAVIKNSGGSLLIDNCTVTGKDYFAIYQCVNDTAQTTVKNSILNNGFNVDAGTFTATENVTVNCGTDNCTKIAASNTGVAILGFDPSSSLDVYNDGTVTDNGDGTYTLAVS